MWTCDQQAVLAALAKEFDFPVALNSPNCALKAAGGACAVVSKQLTTLGAATEDLFAIVGTVRILQIYAVCTAEAEGPNTTFSNCKFSIYDQTNTADMCTVVNASGIEVNDVLAKQADSGSALVWLDVDSAGIYSESGTFRRAFFEGIAAKKTGADTYIRFAYTGDGTTDVTLQFFVRWQPMTADATLTAV